MILRKPYAFLIKYFKLIHVFMFAFLVYLVFSLRSIYVFFSNYVKGNSYVYFEGIAQKYVPILLIFVVVAIMALAIAIYSLMHKKEKPVLFYRITIGYTIILFIALVYFYFFFRSLGNTKYEILRIVINRDIVMVLYYLNFIFVGFSFIRAFGFDIKKFSFEKDRKELKLEEGDSDEYEVNIVIEKEDIRKFFKRHIRELKYYILDNSVFFTIVSIIIVVSLSLYFGYNHFVVNKIYKENQVITVGKVNYTINKSLITNKDKYGRIINEDNEFLIVYLTIKNNGNKLTLNDQQFRVNILDKYYYPSTSFCSSFNDLGECYHNEISSNSEKQYIVIYKLEKSNKKGYFEILKNKNGYQYSRVKLSSNRVVMKTLDYDKGMAFNINNNNYNVLSYSLLNKTSYKYQDCIHDVCKTYTKLISPKLGDKVLVLEIDNLDNLPHEFLENYFGLKYRNSILYGSDIEILDRYNNFVYLGVTSMVHNEDRLVLTINTRFLEYDILLKEGVNE